MCVDWGVGRQVCVDWGGGRQVGVDLGGGLGVRAGRQVGKVGGRQAVEWGVKTHREEATCLPACRGCRGNTQ